MAYQTTIFCGECGESKMVIAGSHGVPTLCGSCQVEKDRKLREEYFAKLADLPIEERLRRIEEWIYDYRPQYVPPPRF